MLYLIHTNRRFQSGFTISELLIASTLGVFLAAAMLQVYLSAKDAFFLNGAKTELFAETRATFRIIRRTIEHAGYRNLDRVTQIDSLSFPADDAFKENQVLIANSTGGKDWVLSTRYLGDDDALIKDCLGRNHATDSLITQTLNYDSETMTLTCQVSCVSLTTPDTDSCTPESVNISERLNTLELLIGYNNSAFKRIVEDYEPIQNLTESPDNILSIKAIAWFESSDAILSNITEQSLTTFSERLVETDRKLRNSVSDTFAVRNRLP